MPRIKALQEEYKTKEVSKWIQERMYHSRISQAKVADRIGVSQQAFSHRLNNKLSLKDIWILDEMLDLTDEELISICRMDGRRKSE